MRARTAFSYARGVRANTAFRETVRAGTACAQRARSSRAMPQMRARTPRLAAARHENAHETTPKRANVKKKRRARDAGDANTTRERAKRDEDTHSSNNIYNNNKRTHNARQQYENSFLKLIQDDGFDG